MIFQHTLEQVLDGSKTRTSRRNHGEDFHDGIVYNVSERYRVWPETGERELLDRKLRRLYYPGQILAVQAKRGGKGLARIRLLAISSVDVRTYTYPDIRREGFSSRWNFLHLWISMHDSGWLSKFSQMPYGDTGNLPVDTETLLRPDKAYHAWALDFELYEQ